MHNEVKIGDGFYYIGSSDRKIRLFESAHPVENGMSYNSYLFLDEKTAVLDAVDRSVSELYFENIDHLLGDRPLDYLIVNHMEPDHAASIKDLLLRHPETTLLMTAMAKRFFMNYFPNVSANIKVVSEGEKLSIGKHEFTFLFASMVHWPEVMMAYESTERVLFSADAFGTFGALNGDIFASERNFALSEARRYYGNIVGKYGDQVLAVLRKASLFNVEMICPLHGPIHQDVEPLLEKYRLWASYAPEEEDGILIAYSSVYGHTQNAVEILASKLAERGLRNIAIYDVSTTDASYLIGEAFRVKTVVLAATTYNAGVFVKMEDFLHDFANHKIRGKTIAFIENGTWGPQAKKCMQSILSEVPGLTYLENALTIASSLKENQLEKLDALADEIAASVGNGKLAEKKEPKPKKVGWRCKICGYTYWGEKLPADFTCPLCGHSAEDFERIEE